jgi:hypothetical protein
MKYKKVDGILIIDNDDLYDPEKTIFTIPIELKRRHLRSLKELEKENNESRSTLITRMIEKEYIELLKRKEK